jgi:hypothetical protein
MNPLLENYLKASGIDLQQASADVALFAAQRSAHLAAAAGQAGFQEALEAEADRVWLFATGRAVRAGDASDARLWGVVAGFLISAAGGA